MEETDRAGEGEPGITVYTPSCIRQERGIGERTRKCVDTTFLALCKRLRSKERLEQIRGMEEPRVAFLVRYTCINVT